MKSEISKITGNDNALETNLVFDKKEGKVFKKTLNFESMVSFQNNWNPQNFGLVTKTSVLIFILFLFTLQNSYSQTTAWNWARSATGNSTDEASTVTTDALGNIYISGYYTSDSIVIGGYTLHNVGLSFNDLYVAKFDPSGNVLWAKRFGGSSNDRGSSITTDKDGNVYLAGYFYSPTIVFGTDTLKNAGVVGDIFIVKFDNQGNVLWAKRDGGPALEIPYSITLDYQNNIIVTGRFSSLSITFGTTTLLQKGSMDIFVVKYDNSGNVLWAKGAGGGTNDEGYGVSSDASGNIYVAGYFTQPANFDAIKLTAKGQSDLFLVKYDSEGNLLWAKGAGGKGDDRANALKTDASNNCYIAGYFTNDSISFGTIAIPNSTGSNSFIAKYDTDGNVVWAKGFGGDSNALGLTIFNKDVFVCGSFDADTLTYASTNLVLNGTSDFFLLNCDTDGQPKWVIKQTSAGESDESAKSIAADNSGNVIISGFFKSKPIFFGSSEINSNRGFDLFVAKLGAVTTKTSDFADIEFNIFPNPGNGLFTLRTKGIINSIEVYTVSGEKIYTATNLNQPGNASLNLSNFTTGIYLVKVKTSNKSYSKKIIIQNQK